MKIATFAVHKYPVDGKEYKIYVRNLFFTWEYLTVFNGEIYAGQVTIRPTLTNWIKSWFGKDLYPEKDRQAAVKYMKMLAETTIDFLIKKSYAESDKSTAPGATVQSSDNANGQLSEPTGNTSPA